MKLGRSGRHDLIMVVALLSLFWLTADPHPSSFVTMDDEQAKVEQFMNVIRTDELTARQYLESCGWSVNEATSAFFEQQDEDENDVEADGNEAADQAPQPVGGASSQAGSSNARAPSSSARPGPRSNERKKFGTLQDFREGEDDESDPDHPHDFFTGGEKSALAVENPNRDRGNIIKDILRKAAEGGKAAPVDEEDEGQEQNRTTFGGAGYTLGSDEQPSTVIRPIEPIPGTRPEAPVDRVLTFWREGFSVEDGPLCRYDDPAHQETLRAINSGRAPLSILNVQHNQAVNVRVEKRMDEDYRPPPKARNPFGGQGQRLGSPVPNVILPPTHTSPSASHPGPGAQRPSLTVDETQAATSIQFRLADGSRLRSRFNESHTVGDLYSFASASRPSSGPFVLMTTFPNKVLEDRAATIKDARLINAVVVQKPS